MRIFGSCGVPYKFFAKNRCGAVHHREYCLAEKKRKKETTTTTKTFAYDFTSECYHFCGLIAESFWRQFITRGVRPPWYMYLQTIGEGEGGTGGLPAPWCLWFMPSYFATRTRLSSPFSQWNSHTKNQPSLQIWQQQQQRAEKIRHMHHIVLWTKPHY